MKALLGQISPIVGDVQGNVARCRAVLETARRGGHRLSVLPELALCGYPPRDLLERPELTTACMHAARDLAQETREGEIAIFGTPWRDERGLRSSAVVASGGRVHAVVHKSRLPTYDVFDEARWFVPEQHPRPVRVDGLTLGVTICEDIWDAGDDRYTADPVAKLSGCDLLVNLSASPFHAGKSADRLALLRRRAAQAGAPLLYCNAVGGNDELLFDGDSLALTADGALRAQGPAFAPAHVAVDLTAPPRALRTPSFSAEVAAALRMGIADYAARCGFTGGVVGLGGGVDSALVAALAAQALGPSNVLTVGMPGPFSSEGSVSDARELARRLGTPFQLIDICGIHRAFEAALALSFADVAPDVTEENLQARARGTVLMALSNKFRRLLLTTGNKSELGVGYCTLYGDMNGGLAVISDLFKTEVYAVCEHLNRDAEIIPRAILDKPPSAELAPDQKDEDSLPPYPVLDAILEGYVVQRCPVSELNARHDPQTVQRVLDLLRRAEHKRWQAAPGLRVSSRAFGTGRRIPLARCWNL